MERIKVLNIASIDSYFQGRYDQSVYEMIFAKREQLSDEQLETAQIIIGNPTKEQLGKCRNLKLLQLSSAGSDFLKKESLPEGCLAANASGTYGIGISEYMIAATIMLMRNFHKYVLNQKKHLWQKERPTFTLYGATVLVVGVGDIGSNYAKRCKSMGAKVIGIRRHIENKPDYLDDLYDLSSLDTLLERADVAAFCLPNSPSTQRIMTKKQFKLMKKTAIIINVGRGSAIVTEDLCDACENGEIFGACIDVCEIEPIPQDHRIWDIENILITPHCSGNLELDITNQNFAAIALNNMENFRNGKALNNEIDFETGYRKYKD